MTVTLLFWIIVSGTLHALWNNLAKNVGKNTTILWFGMSLGGWLLFPVIYTQLKTADLKALLFWSLLSALLHGIYYLCLTYAYSQFNLSTIYPISRGLSIVIAAILSVLLLSDHLNIIGTLGIGFVIGGILCFYSHSKANQLSNHAIQWGIVVGITISGYIIFDYIAIRFINPTLLVCFTFIFMNILLLPYFIIYKKEELLETIMQKKYIASIIGILAVSSYLIIIWVLQSTTLGYVVALRETSIVIAALIACFYFNERQTKRRWVGIAIICLGAILIKFS